MKKLILAALFVLPLCACNQNKASTPEDFATVQKALDENPPSDIIIAGAMGDFTVYVPETAELKAIMQKTASAKPFLSAELTTEQIKEGFCIIDFVSKQVMEELGTPDSKCFYRLYCGSADVDTTTAYAIEVCQE